MRKKLLDWAYEKDHNFLAAIIEEPMLLFYVACRFWLWIPLWLVIVMLLYPKYIDSDDIGLSGDIVMGLSLILFIKYYNK
jgi:hypothetical protein